MATEKTFSELLAAAILKAEDTKPIPPPLGFYRDEAGWTRPVNSMGC